MRHVDGVQRADGLRPTSGVDVGEHPTLRGPLPPAPSAPPDDAPRGLTLRRKLLTVYGGLAALALLVVGISWWAIGRWAATADHLEGHYQRSLLLQKVRAATFRAFKEVPDAVTGGDRDAREEFEALLAPVAADFEQWAGLADTDAEREQVRQVRAAFDGLVATSRGVFDLVDRGRLGEAFDILENQLEDDNFGTFQALTDAAAQSDRDYRQQVRERVAGTRQTAQTVLALAAFGVVALVLLLFAYLASDLFGPLRQIRQALLAAADGQAEQRLDEERADEIGQINRAFNRLMAATERRRRLASLAALPPDGPAGRGTPGRDGLAGAGHDAAAAWRDAPSRATLHHLVGSLRARVAALGSGAGDRDEARARALIGELDRLSQTVARLTEFGLPLDLTLAPTDVRALAYEVPVRFHETLARRGVSLDVTIAPGVGHAVLDRLKMREVLAELVRNGLRALPERGGQLGLRVSAVEDGAILRFEVADDGPGVAPATDGRGSDGRDDGRMDGPGAGLALARAVVEEHGGRLLVESAPGQGTVVAIDLPFRT